MISAVPSGSTFSTTTAPHKRLALFQIPVHAPTNWACATLDASRSREYSTSRPQSSDLVPDAAPEPFGISGEASVSSDRISTWRLLSIDHELNLDRKLW